MASKKREKAALSTGSMARSVSEVGEESDTPSPVTKKKSELQETPTADTEHVKEAPKAWIRGGSSGDASAPPPPLHPKFRVKKKSTMQLRSTCTIYLVIVVAAYLT